MRALPVVASFLVAASFAAPARAEPAPTATDLGAEPSAGPTAVVVLASGSGGVTEEALSQARAAAVSTVALDRARHERTARPERDPALSARAAACGDVACLVALGRDADAAYLVVLQLERQVSAYSATVTLVDVVGGAVAGSAAVDLPGSPDGFVEAMRGPLGPLVAGIAPAGVTTGTVVLTVDRDGATVYLDGEPVGVTPLPPGELEEGEHVVRVELEGFEQAEQRVTVVRRTSTELAVTLVPLPEPEPEPEPAPPPAPVWRRWWFWTAVGGAVALGAGLGIGLGVGLSGGGGGGGGEFAVPFPDYWNR